MKSLNSHVSLYIRKLRQVILWHIHNFASYIRLLKELRFKVMPAVYHVGSRSKNTGVDLSAVSQSNP